VRYPEIDLGRTRVEFNMALTASTALTPDDQRRTERGRSYDAVTWPCDYPSRLLGFRMAEAQLPTGASLQADIDQVRAAYGARRAELEQELANIYADAPAACDTLLSIADEFGPEHAAGILNERPQELGAIRDDDDLPWSDVIDRAGEEMPKLADQHDRLDELTVQREALLRRDQPDRLPVVNIHGREFTLDEARRELRPTDRPDQSYPLDLDPAEQRSANVSEILAQEKPGRQAEPEPPRDRSRSR
jgi:hypothetical protein